MLILRYKSFALCLSFFEVDLLVELFVEEIEKSVAFEFCPGIVLHVVDILVLSNTIDMLFH